MGSTAIDVINLSGANGSLYINDTYAHTGNFFSVQCTEATVFADLTGNMDNESQLVTGGDATSLATGTVVYGRFTNITLTSGAVIALSSGVASGFNPALLSAFSALSLSNGRFGEYVDSFYDDVSPTGLTLANGAGHTFTIFPASSVTLTSLVFSITLDTAVTDQVRVKWGNWDGFLDETIYATDMLALYGESTQLTAGSGTTLDACDWEEEVTVGSPTYAADTTLTRANTGLISGSYIYWQWVFHPTNEHAQYTTPVQRQLLA